MQSPEVISLQETTSMDTAELKVFEAVARAGGICPADGILERHPPQQGALHPGWVSRHAGKGDRVLQHFLVGLHLSPTLYHLHKSIHCGR